MKEFRVSLPDEVVDRLTVEAERIGIVGRYAVSSCLRHLAYTASGSSSDVVEPIVVYVPTLEQRRDYVAYSAAKCRPSVEAWAAEAIATERNRTHLTARQIETYDAVYQKMARPPKAVQLEGK